MAEICPVCNKKIGWMEVSNTTSRAVGYGGVYFVVHMSCVGDFDANPEKYGGKAIEVEESRAEICPVCDKSISVSNQSFHQGIKMHYECEHKFKLDPEKYGGTVGEAEEWSHLICPVCNKEMLPRDYKKEIQHGIVIHDECESDLEKLPEIIAKAKRAEEKRVKANEEEQAKQAEANFNKIIEQSKIDEASLQEINDKSVYVKGFSMPFGEMVIFALKWMLAMIPALILFWIIIALFTALFGVSLMSIFL